MKLFSSAFLAMGIYMSCFVIHGLWKMHESKDWDVIDGVVISSKLDGSGELKVEYSYIVNGIEYSNDKEYFGWRIESKHGITGTNGVMYKAGRNIEIFFDSNDPSDSVLDRDTRRGIYIPLLFIFGFLSFGVYGVFIHQDKKTSQVS